MHCVIGSEDMSESTPMCIQGPCVDKYLLLNVTKNQQSGLTPLVSNLMLHACCLSIRSHIYRQDPP